MLGRGQQQVNADGSRGNLVSIAWEIRRVAANHLCRYAASDTGLAGPARAGLGFLWRLK